MAAVLPHGFLCLQLIENHDTEKCMLELSQIEALKAKFPKTAMFMPPNPDLAADCVSTEWIAFPEYPFEIVGRLDDLFPKRDDTLRNVEAVCLEPADKRKFVRPGVVGKADSTKEEVAQTVSSATQSDNPFGASSLLARFKKPKVEEVKKAEGSFKPKLLIGDQVLFKKRKAEVVNVDDSDSIVTGLLTKIQDASSMLAKEVELWKAKVDEIKAENGKILKEKDVVIKSKDSRIKDIEMEIKGLKSELDDVDKKKMEELHMQKEYYVKEAGRTLFEARIQMIEEYLAGKAGEWNLEEEKVSLREIDGSTFEAGEVSSKPQDVDQMNQAAGEAGLEG